MHGTNAGDSPTSRAVANAFVRQHLIDPEVCIRCNTCEEICPSKAISHDQVNYVVDFEKCSGKGDCLPPCPTGAIDNWRRVVRALTLSEQFALESLPSDAEPVISGGGGPVPEDVKRIAAEAVAGSGGREVPPWSAAHPYVSLYGPDAPAVATVSGNYRLTEPGSSVDIHHIVLDFGRTAFPVLEGQSVGILPPGLDEHGKPHHVRLYSIASPREGERPGYNNIALSIKRVVEDADGRPVHGVASNYLCDLKKGDQVTVTGPYGTTFLMPNNPGANIVMICTGTGSAPMRAMTERLRRRRHRGDQGHLKLFFGARTSGELPYFGPLMKLPKEFIDVQLAFSREPGQGKEYVQDRMRKCAADVAGLLRSDETYIYICGHKRMEQGVFESLTEICAAHGMNWAELMPRLRQQGRYHVETYY